MARKILTSRNMAEDVAFVVTDEMTMVDVGDDDDDGTTEVDDEEPVDSC